MIDFPAERSRIQQVVLRLMDAQERKDVEAVLALTTEDALMLRPKQPLIRGRDDWRQDYERYFRTSISEMITPLKREIAAGGDMAWEYGEYHGMSESPAGPVSSEGKYLCVLAKVNEEWRIAAVSLSP